IQVNGWSGGTGTITFSLTGPGAVSGSRGFTLLTAGSTSLTLDKGGANPEINKVAGDNDTLAVPLIIHPNPIVTNTVPPSPTGGQLISAGPISGVGGAGITLLGGGILALGIPNGGAPFTNSYTGLTTVTNGIVAVGGDAALGSAAAGTTIANGSALY